MLLLIVGNKKRKIKKSKIKIKKVNYEVNIFKKCSSRNSCDSYVSDRDNCSGLFDLFINLSVEVMLQSCRTGDKTTKNNPEKKNKEEQLQK